MKLHELQPAAGSKKTRTRVGRWRCGVPCRGRGCG